MTVALDDLLQHVISIEESLSGLVDGKKTPGEDDVWPLYARSEMVAAILKYRMKVERPGILQKLPKSDAPEEFLPPALEALRRALSSLREGRAPESLEQIREARTLLRAFLASKKRLAAREKRRSRTAARRASS